MKIAKPMLFSLSCLFARVPAGTQDIFFYDLAQDQGLDFVHDHGGSGKKYYVETMGSGVCLLDYDNDHDLDIYFCQGSALPGWDKKIILENKLFQNDDGRWTDVTAVAGVGDKSYSTGCACGDVDNDGDTDLYVTNFGMDIFYRNNGNGTFTDVTDAVGINNHEWGSSAAFFDMDNDGFLDLYVTNYVEYSLGENPWCGDKRTNRRAYCDPDIFAGSPDRLFHNLGDWVFNDISAASGVMAQKGKGLGVIPADFDQDGDLDLYVANDKVMNHYYINDGQGHFKENALFTGVGFNENGRAEAGMGVDIGDVNGDGWQDLFVTNFSGETNTIYINNQQGFFSDETFLAGLGQPSLNYLGFGTKLLDLNCDGWLDLFVVNGHVIDNIHYFNKDYTHAQPKQIFLNNRNGTFRELLPEQIGDANRPSVGRGAAFGDLDNDGDIDAVIANNNEPANLLIRDGTPNGNWIGF
ncbi:MAG: VCBS repeat-containing protein, partial [Candidatus Neomarinimicrobiota bacterium]|nr:VCBS repeat-containing protein [Candidatus Neomarinimicrobiota bacterium]